MNIQINWAISSWHEIATWHMQQRIFTCQYHHYNDIIMNTMASQITSLTSVYSIVYSGADQRKHQSSMSLAFARESPHKRPVTWKMFPFEDIIMTLLIFMHMPSEIQILTHTRPRDMARSRPPFWIFSFAAWKWVNMDGNWRNFDGNISSYV